MDAVRSMRLFVAVAEAGNLSAVARGWGVSPSTVSLGLRQLEDQLGAQLVLRTTRQLSLTPEGDSFLARARRLLAEIDETMAGFAERGPLSGSIRITATNDFGRNRLAPLLDGFAAAHPAVRLQLMLSDSVVDLVDEGYDIGIRTGPLPDSDLRARLLLRGHKCVCAAPAYWAARGRPQHPRELTRHDCIVLGGPRDTQAFWSFRGPEGGFRVRVQGNRQVNDGQTLRDWAVAGAGVILKSSFDVAEDVAAGRLECVLAPFLSQATNLYAVTPARLHDARRVGALLDHLGQALAAP
ncbi:LysR family transcriptional regulator [Frigidibacter sp. MR17.24]|uniref:LysR family transcriptional regulator n=1 Tax=Frigidibacter sp. MR17.24 TaxID=3127345 RepID=UPI003012CF1D